MLKYYIQRHATRADPVKCRITFGHTDVFLQGDGDTTTYVAPLSTAITGDSFAVAPDSLLTRDALVSIYKYSIYKYEYRI